MTVVVVILDSETKVEMTIPAVIVAEIVVVVVAVVVVVLDVVAISDDSVLS